jgi:hypothetical protein
MIKKSNANIMYLPNPDNESVDPVPVDLWLFEPHEEQAIREILAGCKFRSAYDNIDEFIGLLATRCGHQKEFIQERELKSRATIRENREKLRSMLTDLHNRITNKLGFFDANGEKPIHEYIDIADDDRGELMHQLMENFSKMIPLLRASIRIIEDIEKKDPKKHGRPTADEDNFVYDLAYYFLIWIETPTTYDGGPFYNLVLQLYKVLGLREEEVVGDDLGAPEERNEGKSPDVSTAVEEAIRKLKEEFKKKNIKLSPPKRRKKI